VDTTTGITATQFSPAGHPFQHTASDDHAITDHMSGTAFDPHHPAPTIFECHFYRNTMVGYNHTFADRFGVRKVGRRSRAGSFVTFNFQSAATSRRLSVCCLHQKDHILLFALNAT
jgi:hypothetical protein